MILKPYSEKLKRYFDTEEECIEAEKIFDEKEAEVKKFKEEKKKAAKHLEELKDNMLAAYKEAEAQYNTYNAALKEFTEKYSEPFRTIECSIPIGSPAHMLNHVFKTFFNF